MKSITYFNIFYLFVHLYHFVHITCLSFTQFKILFTFIYKQVMFLLYIFELFTF